MAAIYTVFTSPHHAPMPNHLPTLIVTPHGQPNQILYTYLHTEENRVNYLLTPSPQGDLCVAKLFPPSRPGANGSSASVSTQTSKSNVVRCEASRDLRWTIENTGVMSPIYKIINQDDTPLYQISKPNPNAEFWTMFYFKYAGHQIPPKRVEFGKVAKNPPEKGGGTRITVTGKTEDEKQVWQTLGVGNEDCVEWVVCCACLNLLDDQILQAAEKKNPKSPASTVPAIAASSPASTRPATAPIQRPNHIPPGPSSLPGRAPPPGGGIASSRGPGIASTSLPNGGTGGNPVVLPSNQNLNLAQTYRQNPGMQTRNPIPPQGQGPPGGYRPPGPPQGMSNGMNGGGMRPQQPPPMQHSYSNGSNGSNGGGYDPRMRPPGQQMQMQGMPPPQQQQQQQRNGFMNRAPPAQAGRRF